MKTAYEAPAAEVVSFTALEQLATLEIQLEFGDSNFNADVTSRVGF